MERTDRSLRDRSCAPLFEKFKKIPPEFRQRPRRKEGSASCKINCVVKSGGGRARIFNSETSIKIQTAPYHETCDCNTGATHHGRVFLHINSRPVDATFHVSVRRIHRVRADIAVESLEETNRSDVRESRRHWGNRSE